MKIKNIERARAHEARAAINEDIISRTCRGSVRHCERCGTGVYRKVRHRNRFNIRRRAVIEQLA